MKVCVFDLDGTLADTIASLVYSVNLSLVEMGLPEISKEKCQSFVGNGARVLMSKSLIEAGETDTRRIDEAMEVYGRVFGKNCTYQVEPYPGICELIKKLKEQGVKLAVLSNKPHNQTVVVVEEVFGKGTFDFIQGQKDEFPKKPDPAGVLLALESCGGSVEECVYVGDSEVDVATGRSARALTLAVTWGFRSVEELKEAGADHLVEQASEILTYVNEI